MIKCFSFLLLFISVAAYGQKMSIQQVFTFPSDTVFDGKRFGGISAMHWDQQNQKVVCASDAPGAGAYLFEFEFTAKDTVSRLHFTGLNQNFLFPRWTHIESMILLTDTLIFSEEHHERGQEHSGLYQYTADRLDTLYQCDFPLAINKGIEALSAFDSGYFMIVEKQLNRQAALGLYLKGDSIERFDIPLQSKEEDAGITSAIQLNDSTLFLLERDFDGKQNHIYLHQFNWKQQRISKTHALHHIPYSNNALFKINNMESMAWNAATHTLMLWSDNNFGNGALNTPTQCVIIHID